MSAPGSSTGSLQATLTGNNLTDRTYYAHVRSAVGYNFYGEPRNFTLTLRYGL